MRRVPDWHVTLPFAQPHRGVAPGPGRARLARRRRCPLGDAECMVDCLPAHGRPMGWSGSV
jgi:hypothetical protein